MAERILDLTRNLLALYLYICGESEVPRDYHQWAFLTLVSACLSDRVWVEKMRHAPVVPNLYTLLIGPSGCGRGEATDSVLQFARPLADAGRLDLFAGNTTAQGLIEHLAKKRKNEGAHLNGKIFLVTEELGMNIGEGQMARDFIKTMTGLYKGSPYGFRKRTVTGGLIETKGQCIVWLGGSNRTWLIESLPKSAIEGGALARIVPIDTVYATKRIVYPQYPPDTDEVSQHILERLMELTEVRGPSTNTLEAEKLEAQWYKDRPDPADESLYPSWRREHDLTIKLQTILAACDDPSLVRNATHVIRAQQLSARAMRTIPSLIAFASMTPDTAAAEAAFKIIERLGRIQHSQLVKRMSTKGFNRDQVRHGIATLNEGKRITIVGRHGSHSDPLTYWRKQRVMPPTNKPEPEPEDDGGEDE